MNLRGYILQGHETHVGFNITKFYVNEQGIAMFLFVKWSNKAVNCLRYGPYQLLLL
jgi:hypothetical protein